MRCALIDAREAGLSVERACRLLHVSSSGYYAWRDRPTGKRQQDDVIYLAHIRSFFYETGRTYGSPRMTAELQEHGFDIGRRRVARLMKDSGLQARQTRRFKRTTDSRHTHPVYVNLLAQDFIASCRNEKWGVAREADVYVKLVMSGPMMGGCILRLSSIFMHAALLAGLAAIA